jgi:acetyl-CoA decarbonylase/synthase complex subunit gamma
METKPAAWLEGTVSTSGGDVPRISTRLRAADRFGLVARRFGMGRSGYTVPPGLYAVGSPTPDSIVLVSANYKMSFDRLRMELGGIDAWILVLDTRGINVWCAAGKGTFGTEELIGRVRATELQFVVRHRTLIVPQLGGPGVCAHAVKKGCGFRVVYGPVRAADLPRFLALGMKADPEMRRVRFNLADRAAVIPVELMLGGWMALLLAMAFFGLSGLGVDGYSWDRAVWSGPASAGLILAAFLAGAVATPLLLPWLPGRPFALKGALAGLLAVLAMWGLCGPLPGGPLALPAWFLLAGALSSFVAMNFTGASTYTSLSGVMREMRLAVPAQAAAAAVGLGLWLVSLFGLA